MANLPGQVDPTGQKPDGLERSNPQPLTPPNANAASLAQQRLQESHSSLDLAIRIEDRQITELYSLGELAPLGRIDKNFILNPNNIDKVAEKLLTLKELANEWNNAPGKTKQLINLLRDIREIENILRLHNDKSEEAFKAEIDELYDSITDGNRTEIMKQIKQKNLGRKDQGASLYEQVATKMSILDKDNALSEYSALFGEIPEILTIQEDIYYLAAFSLGEKFDPQQAKMTAERFQEGLNYIEKLKERSHLKLNDELRKQIGDELDDTQKLVKDKIIFFTEGEALFNILKQLSESALLHPLFEDRNLLLNLAKQRLIDSEAQLKTRLTAIKEDANRAIREEKRYAEHVAKLREFNELAQNVEDIGRNKGQIQTIIAFKKAEADKALAKVKGMDFINKSYDQVLALLRESTPADNQQKLAKNEAISTMLKLQALDRELQTMVTQRTTDVADLRKELEQAKTAFREQAKKDAEAFTPKLITARDALNQLRADNQWHQYFVLRASTQKLLEKSRQEFTQYQNLEVASDLNIQELRNWKSLNSELQVDFEAPFPPLSAGQMDNYDRGIKTHFQAFDLTFIDKFKAQLKDKLPNAVRNLLSNSLAHRSEPEALERFKDIALKSIQLEFPFSQYVDEILPLLDENDKRLVLSINCQRLYKEGQMEEAIKLLAEHPFIKADFFKEFSRTDKITDFEAFSSSLVKLANSRPEVAGPIIRDLAIKSNDIGFNFSTFVADNVDALNPAAKNHVIAAECIRLFNAEEYYKVLQTLAENPDAREGFYNNFNPKSKKIKSELVNDLKAGRINPEAVSAKNVLSYYMIKFNSWDEKTQKEAYDQLNRFVENKGSRFKPFFEEIQKGLDGNLANNLSGLFEKE